MTDLARNLIKFSKKFAETADLAWLIRYAQEANLAESLTAKPGQYRPLQLPDFIESLGSQDVLESEDPIQTALNQATAAVLLDYVGGLPEDLRPLVKAGESPREILNPHLWPNEKEMPAIGAAILEKFRAGSGNRELVSGFSQRMAIRAVEHVLARVCADLVAKNLWQNPILLFLPQDRVAEFIKTAASNQGPRLSNLIEALRISIGRYTVEMILARKKLETMEEGREKQKLRTAVYNTTRKIAVLDAYVNFLTRARASLAALMASDPDKQLMKYKDGSFVTSDPFVAPDFSSADSFLKLVRPKEKQTAFKVPMWDGSEEEISGFRLPQRQIAHTYVGTEMQNSDFRDKLVGRMVENAKLYKEYARAANESEHTKKISKLFPEKDVGFAFDLYRDIVASIERAQVVPTQDQLVAAEEGADYVLFLRDEIDRRKSNLASLPPEEIFARRNEIEELEKELREQEFAENKAARAHEQEQEAMLRSVISDIVSRYEGQASIKGDLFEDAISEIVRSIATTEVFDTSPADWRFFKTLGGMKATGEGFYMLPKGNDATVSNLAAEAFPDTKEILESEQFKIKYATNDREYNEWEKTVAEPEDPIKKRIQDGQKYLGSPAGRSLLKKIGIDPEILRSVRDKKAFEKSFGEMLEKVFRKSQEQLQAELGDIPLDALYAYLGSHFFHVVENELAEKLARRWSGAIGTVQEREDGAGDEDDGPEIDSEGGGGRKELNQAAEDEARIYLAERFLPVQAAKATTLGGKTALRAQTAAGLMAEIHIKLDEMEKSGKRLPLSAVLKSKARRSFGNFLKEQTRAKIDDELAKNKAASDAAEKAGLPFDWKKLGKPRDKQELWEYVGAFADPIPGVGELGGRQKYREDSSKIQPAQRASDEDLAQMRSAGAPEFDTVDKATERMVFHTAKIGGTVGQIGALKEAFERRRQEILKLNSAYARDILPFKIETRVRPDGKKERVPANQNKTANPFVHQGLYNEEPAPAPVSPKQDPTTISLPELPGAEKNPEISDPQTVKPPTAHTAVEPATEVVTPPASTMRRPTVVRRKYEEKAALPPTEKAPGPRVPKSELSQPEEDAVITTLNRLHKNLDQSIETKIAENSKEQGRQLVEVTNLIEVAQAMLTGARAAAKKSDRVAQAVKGFETKLYQLQLLEAKLRRLAEEAELHKDALLRSKNIKPHLDRILAAITQRPKWSEEAIFAITQTISTLMHGSPGEVVYLPAIKKATNILETFAKAVEQFQRLTLEERKKMGALEGFDERSAEQLQKKLEDVRSGSGHFKNLDEEPPRQK